MPKAVEHDFRYAEAAEQAVEIIAELMRLGAWRDLPRDHIRGAGGAAHGAERGHESGGYRYVTV